MESCTVACLTGLFLSWCQLGVFVAVIVLPALAAASAVVAVRLWLQRISAEQAAARELRRRVAALRARLGMQRGDGFVFGCALAAAAARPITRASI